MSTKTVFEIILAGNSVESESLDNLILWVAASNDEDALAAMGALRPLAVGGPKAIEVDAGDFGVDHNTSDNPAELQAQIQRLYVDVVGQDMELKEPGPNSSYNCSFTGHFHGLKISGTECYLTIMDSDNDCFDCDPREVLSHTY